ncbi:helix-turn-helix transcriptional regulator [Agrobacterium rhizogenes]|nr:helix-turn-helix transcriptional regulator [Rhizobium rhizogenes]NTI86011.1 helix-turn-helix transcriptional regulator [Rhizobium rhizogenes]
MKPFLLQKVSTCETYRGMEHPIVKYRREHNLTQDAFGKRVGATKGMVSKWEACRVLPRPSLLVRIEDVSGGCLTAGSIVRSFVAAAQFQEAAE